MSLRHSLPLANFTAGDVDAPLEVLLDLADTLEGNLTGRDDF